MKFGLKFLFLLFLLPSGNFGQWVQFQSHISTRFTSIQYLDSQNVFISGLGGVIVKSSNGGVNWQTINTDPAFFLHDIFFVNVLTGYAVGSGPPTYYPLVKTTNGGINWTPQWVQIDLQWTSVYFFNSNTGVAIGNSGGSNATVFRTTNGGINWLFTILNPYWGISRLRFINSQTGFAVGNVVLKTVNMGVNWTYIAPTPVLSFNDFVALDEFILVAVASNGKIMKTSDGGINWIELNSGTSNNLFGISFPTPATGYVVGTPGLILKTSNGGVTWYQQQNPSSGDISKINMFNANTGICVGFYIDTLMYGLILRTTNGGTMVGINTGGNGCPNHFSLSQNYSNPFNPATTIKYDIPPLKGARGMMVQLIIYDVLGREIETLVNESQKPGSYEVQWDGSRYASGVYFYKLVTEEFVETKKMVLLK